MNRWKEIAKFACGAEAFHAFIHLVCWLSGATLNVLGFAVAPTWHLWGFLINAVIAVVLGYYAWRATAHRVA